MLGAFAIVCSWGIPALIRTNGEFFRVGIGRHVVERSFNVMEGHGANSWNTYLAAMPFYFLTVFISFFPWSIKLPALTKQLWRKRDAIDNYLISGILHRFRHHEPGENEAAALHAAGLSAALALAGPAFVPSSAVRRKFRQARAPSARSPFPSAPRSSSFRSSRRPFLRAQLYKMSRNDLRPEMDFANIDYAEPSVVWYFRSRAHGFFRGLSPDQVEAIHDFPGPRFVIVPTQLAKAFSAKFRRLENVPRQGFHHRERPTDDDPEAPVIAAAVAAERKS